jgi:hypothetical protein
MLGGAVRPACAASTALNCLLSLSVLDLVHPEVVGYVHPEVARRCLARASR